MQRWLPQLVMIIGVGYGGTSPAEAQRDLVAIAEQHIAASRFRAARRLLMRAKELGDAERARLVAATALMPQGPPADRHATAEIRWLVDFLEPDERRSVQLRRAWARFILGDHEPALATFAAQLQLQDHTAARLLSQMAALAVRRGQLHIATRALQMARRAVPQNASLALDHAAVLTARGHPQAALRLIAGVLQTHPDDEQAQQDLAAALLALGRADEALAVLSSRAAHPDAPYSALVALAAAALEAAQPAQALHAADRAIATRVESAGGFPVRAQLLAGRALARLGRSDEARARLRALQAILPDDRDVERALAALSNAEGPTPRKP